MLANLFYLLILLIGIPVGLFLVKLCKDETESWKFRFKLIIGVCLVLVLIMGFSGFEFKVPVIVSLLFVVVTSVVVVRRG